MRPDCSGMFGDKNATLARFKENYVKLSERVKKRLVLENDDMCWSVEDLLPTCQELGIPLVLVFFYQVPSNGRIGIIIMFYRDLCEKV
jgi:UV DNA damage repair endonuclease